MCGTTLAMVLYPLGEHERALSALESVADDNVVDSVAIHEDALWRVYRDLALLRLGRPASPDQTLAALDDALQKMREWEYVDLQAARRELVHLTGE
jgi:hypothetical protein